MLLGGRPIRKWPGVRTSNPSSELGRGHSSWEFRHNSTCVRTVLYSSKFNLASAMILWRCNFALLSASSHSPPKCGAHSEINFHCILCVRQNLDKALWVSLLLAKLTNCFNSWAAPTKLVSLSLHMTLGMPRLAINHRKVPMKASEVKSETIPNEQPKTQIYAFFSTGLQTGPLLSSRVQRSGHAWSVSVNRQLSYHSWAFMQLWWNSPTWDTSTSNRCNHPSRSNYVVFVT